MEISAALVVRGRPKMSSEKLYKKNEPKLAHFLFIKIF